MSGKRSEIDVELRSTNIGRKLLLAFDAHERRIVRGIRDRGFPDFKPSDGSALRNVSVEGSRLTEIARRAHMTKQGMGQLVHDLSRRGYVQVAVDPSDGRARLVTLSEKGRALIRAGQDTYRELEAEWAAELGQANFSRLSNLLSKVVDSFGASQPTSES